ncbi:CidA/LrgA family protein [Budvicia diplopodorum]|uniref:CidA/LrgA family protein n=1 Tax=Budvicia diplopodorum TaxID=1119056 RepID=UPI001357DEBC|nr:CidA/LrgA family protein [Budvicia diplopodorum]
MRSFLRLCWQYLRAFILIYLCLLIGNAISAIIPLSIPGSIIGMMVLFALLSSQILPSDWVKPGCRLFTRHMALLFIPISVGIMNYYPLLISQFGPLVVSCLVSSLVTMLIVGFSSHYVHGVRNAKADKEPS